MNLIPVTFVNLFTSRHLAQAVVPALPAAGDFVYVRDLGYEVINCTWMVQADGMVAIVVALRPQLDADEARPFSYGPEAESFSGDSG